MFESEIFDFSENLTGDFVGNFDFDDICLSFKLSSFLVHNFSVLELYCGLKIHK